ncbi:MAG: exodeoxyribonuclease V subunit alpha [Proteobacteria bacterium]|nr:exodeoxyribonuclease V subunit alpha [Pseudomonadota bacterium]
MIPAIEILHEKGYLAGLDIHFARTVGALIGENRPLVLLGAAAASRFTGNGHVCAPIERIAGTPIQTLQGEPLKEFCWPEQVPWLTALEQSPMIGDGSFPTPLVLNRGRLYLTRYWRYEQSLAELVVERAGYVADDLSEELLTASLDRLFKKGSDDTDKQQSAVRKALKSRFSVISGGPGTGKTSAVVKILAILVEQASALNRPLPRILLTAPTGKAAARMTESIRIAKAATGRAALKCAKDIKEAIPEEAATLHRALGARLNEPTQFQRNKENPLAADVVIVDEASMIDIALMTKLIGAVPKTSRLILLGDKNQLSSVEAGAVLGDICNAGSAAKVVHLTHSYRFDLSSGIGRLARSINDNQAGQVISDLESGNLSGVDLVEPSDTQAIQGLIEPFVLRNYTTYLKETAPLKRLEQFSKSRVLCAHRKGQTGAYQINKLIEKILLNSGCLHPKTKWYDGQPVLVTRNDYQLGLFNGDVGLACSIHPGSSELRAVFDSTSDEIRSFAMSRLPPIETVFAMTVHKAQGSEFDQILIVLPEHMSPIITRELLYTAVTRAREHVTILASKQVIRQAIETPVERTSGLEELMILNSLGPNH